MDANHCFADHAWTPQGFMAEVGIDLGRDGALCAVTPAAARDGADRIGRYVLPGMPNLHSHAFQRAMAGLAERSTPALVSGSEDQTPGRASQPADDSFWTWREVMYAFASRIGPDELQAIAAQLYVEMLKAGYTQVCEFHYLHHQPDGRPYDDPAAMSLALVEAAREAGIGLTLLPTLYMTGGFDGRPLSERQRRFGHDVDAYLRLVERLRALESPTLRAGVALHSLRAVPEHALRAVLDAVPRREEAGAIRHRDAAEPSPQLLSRGESGAMPIHIHIAEQLGEVQDCLALRRARPVDWLLDHAAGRCALVPGPRDAPERGRNPAAGAHRRGGRPVPDHRSESR